MTHKQGLSELTKQKATIKTTNLSHVGTADPMLSMPFRISKSTNYPNRSTTLHPRFKLLPKLRASTTSLQLAREPTSIITYSINRETTLLEADSVLMEPTL